MIEKTESRVKFDATINLGHIITFVGFLISGAGMYMSMDKRVVILEESRITQAATDQRQNSSIDENKRNVREDLREINTKLDRLIERK